MLIRLISTVLWMNDCIMEVSLLVDMANTCKSRIMLENLAAYFAVASKAVRETLNLFKMESCVDINLCIDSTIGASSVSNLLMSIDIVLMSCTILLFVSDTLTSCVSVANSLLSNSFSKSTTLFICSCVDKPVAEDNRSVKTFLFRL